VAYNFNRRIEDRGRPDVHHLPLTNKIVFICRKLCTTETLLLQAVTHRLAPFATAFSDVEDHTPTASLPKCDFSQSAAAVDTASRDCSAAVSMHSTQRLCFHSFILPSYANNASLMCTCCKEIIFLSWFVFV